MRTSTYCGTLCRLTSCLLTLAEVPGFEPGASDLESEMLAVNTIPLETSMPFGGGGIRTLKPIKDRVYSPARLTICEAPPEN